VSPPDAIDDDAATGEQVSIVKIVVHQPTLLLPEASAAGESAA
jgi:hypothetical protein